MVGKEKDTKLRPSGLSVEEENFRLRTQVEKLQLEAEIRRLGSLVETLQAQNKQTSDEATGLKQQNGRLEEENMEIKRQRQVLLRNFACMSHEIRTPLVGSIVRMPCCVCFARRSFSFFCTSVSLDARYFT